MADVVKLEEIIEALEIQSSEMRSFLNLTNGEIVTVTDEELRVAEDEESIVDLPSWEQDIIKTAQEILEEDFFISLPSQFEINEYRIIEEFCLSIKEDSIRDTIYNSIKGSGAFRRFKDKIRKLGIEEEWYKYRTNAIKEIAVQWCEENEIEYKWFKKRELIISG